MKHGYHDSAGFEIAMFFFKSVFHTSATLFRPESLNPLHAKFFRGNKNIHLHFMSSLHIDMTLVVGVLPQVRQRLTYST